MKIKVKSRGEDPSKLPPPGERPGTTIVDAGIANPPLPIYIRRKVLDNMRRHARSGEEFEVGGFVLGGYHHWEGRRYVDITVSVPALKARSARTHLTFDNDAQKEFNQIVAKRYPDKLVLGWYHTHPAYGVFLSEYDMFIQRGFFAQEHHVAIVIDPYQQPRNQVGVFTWHEGDVSNGYHLITYDRVGDERLPKLDDRPLSKRDRRRDDDSDDDHRRRDDD